MADMVNVLVKAPDAMGASRVAKRNSVEPGEASRLVKADDEIRARFVRLFYNVDWSDESNFDLVIDSDSMSERAAIAQIAAAAAALPALTGGERAAATIQVDPVLAKTAEAALSRRSSGSDQTAPESRS